jgi:hypothetical protein
LPPLRKLVDNRSAHGLAFRAIRPLCVREACTTQGGGTTMEKYTYEKPAVADYGDLVELTAANQMVDTEDGGAKPPFHDGSAVPGP